jgi:hypothetical protein
MFQHTYFEFSALLNPFPAIARRLNPYRHKQTIDYRGRPLTVEWTERAERELRRREEPLTAEMQLYFSCVVKKRVLFERPADNGFALVNEKLSVAFHAVEASACDPIEFAQHYPERRRLESSAAARMHPRRLLLDYAAGGWRGEFRI